MLQVAMTDGGGAHHERAVSDGVGNGSVFLGVPQNLSATYCRTRVAKGAIKRIHNPQVRAPEVAHGAGGRANVERISRRNEDDAQAIEFARKWQEPILCQDSVSLAGNNEPMRRQRAKLSNFEPLSVLISFLLQGTCCSCDRFLVSFSSLSEVTR